MKWNKEEWESFEGFASMFYSIKTIAGIMEVETKELQSEYRDKTSEVFKRYNAAFLKSEAQVRLSEINLAKSGSSQAQQTVRKYIDNAGHDNH